MYINILNRKISTSIIAISLTIFALLITIFFIVLFKVDDKTISIINFYEQPVKVSIRGVEFLIQPFDTKVFTMNTSNTFDVNVSDNDGNYLQNVRVFGLTRASQLVSIALNSEKQYCFFNAEVNTDEGGNIIVVNKKRLNEEPQNFGISDMNTSFIDYGYPGNLPEVAADRFTRPINYVYPISCNLVDNDDNIIKTIAAFSDYKPEDQLKYLNDIKSKVLESTNVDSLNSALPSKASKYYISEENYIFVYE